MSAPRRAAAPVGADGGGADRADEADRNNYPTAVKSPCPMICAGDEACTRTCPSPWPPNVVDAMDCPADRCIPDRRNCPSECVLVVGVDQ